ncbi:MAG: macro domain-containing protein [Candidatus Coprovivens sp.]
MDKKIYLDKVLEFLVKDKNIDIPDSLRSKVNLWEDLVSKLDVDDIPDEVLLNEDKYLRLELLNKRLTDGEKVKTISDTLNSNLKYSTKISLWKGDITTIYADVLVNSTTSDMIGCREGIKGTLDNAIFTRSGMRLRMKCRDIMRGETLNNSEILVTRAYNLPSDYIIHVVVPVVSDVLGEQEKIELKMCYLNVLECARNNMAKTIVFPCLGTGTNRFSKKEAAIIAINAVNEFLDKHNDEIEKIIFDVLDDESYSIYSDLLIGEDNA